MFAERLDALMNITGITNSLLGRELNMNSSHLGRFRNGARPLPKKHDFVVPMCEYLTKHITKDYQITALRNLTGMTKEMTSKNEDMAKLLVDWLLDKKGESENATSRFISGFSRVASSSQGIPVLSDTSLIPVKYAPYYYGNAGKRKAVEQFFLMILEEKEPQTLLLFSDEDMSWMYEDSKFVTRWTELFTKILMKGNRVKMIHTVTRNIGEMLEAILKWIPIYMTGMVEPYYFPRTRDGLFQRTIFLAPKTVGVLSSCVSQNTEGRLNQFVTDKAALSAIEGEYNDYISLCKPLMQIFTRDSVPECKDFIQSVSLSDQESIISHAMPLLFSMPKKLAIELAKQHHCPQLLDVWEKSYSSFKSTVKSNAIIEMILPLNLGLMCPDLLTFPLCNAIGCEQFSYTKEQYEEHFNHLLFLEKQYKNLKVLQNAKLDTNTLIYIKEGCKAVIAKADTPSIVFMINELNMINAFWDYLKFDAERLGI